MKPEVRKVRAAAVAANLAAQAAVAARELLEEDPSAWELGDAAYWLCRAAQKVCETPPTRSTPKRRRPAPTFSPRTSSPAAPRRRPATRRTNWSPWPRN